MTEVLDQQMKHPQHIVAFPAHLVDDRVNGWSDYQPKGTDLVMACREHLEKDFSYRQLLPVFLLVCDRKVWCYTRGRNGGEPDLHGKVASAVGGHWDIGDLAINHNSTIDFERSLKIAGERELVEEVELASADILKITTLPKIYAADNDPVDRKHACVVTVYELKPGTIVDPKEAELEAMGFLSTNDLYDLNMSGRVLETWTHMAIAVCRDLDLID